MEKTASAARERVARTHLFAKCLLASGLMKLMAHHLRSVSVSRKYRRSRTVYKTSSVVSLVSDPLRPWTISFRNVFAFFNSSLIESGTVTGCPFITSLSLCHGNRSSIFDRGGD